MSTGFGSGLAAVGVEFGADVTGPPMAAAQAESCSTQADSPSPQTTLSKRKCPARRPQKQPVRQPRTEEEDHPNDQPISKLATARKVMIIAAIAGAFLLSASMALILNSQGNSGEQVAEAASRVNRQVDDTQDAFSEIKELIPEEHRLEAAPATTTSTGKPVAQCRLSPRCQPPRASRPSLMTARAHHQRRRHTECCQQLPARLQLWYQPCGSTRQRRCFSGRSRGVGHRP